MANGSRPPRPTLTTRIWPIAGGKAEHVLKDEEHPPHRVAWTPDGKLLAVGNQDGSITLYDDKAKRLGMHNYPVPTKTGIRVLTFAPGGRELLVAGPQFEDPDDNKLRSAKVIDVSTAAERAAGWACTRATCGPERFPRMANSPSLREANSTKPLSGIPPTGRWCAAFKAEGPRSRRSR